MQSSMRGLLLLHAWLEGHEGSEKLAEQLAAGGANDLHVSQAIHYPQHEGIAVIECLSSRFIDSQDVVSSLRYQTAFDAVAYCKTSRQGWQAFASRLYERAQQISSEQEADGPDIASVNYAAAMSYAHSLTLDCSSVGHHSRRLHILLRVLNSAEASLGAVQLDQLNIFKLDQDAADESDSNEGSKDGKMDSKERLVKGGAAAVAAVLGRCIG